MRATGRPNGRPPALDVPISGATSPTLEPSVNFMVAPSPIPAAPSPKPAAEPKASFGKIRIPAHSMAQSMDREGIGPEELRAQMRIPPGDAGSLAYTHGFKKRS